MEFPLYRKYGNARVPVYRVKTNNVKSGVRFVVAHRTKLGVRKQEPFSDVEEAKKRALQIAKDLSFGDSEMVEIPQCDRAEFL
jgi:hypothetical protein